MRSRIAASVLACLALTTIVRAQDTTPPALDKPASGDKPTTKPTGPQRVFGQVSAVRGNVLQIKPEEGDGLTRVILAADAKIIRDEKLPLDSLKPGMKVMGGGRPAPEGSPAGARVEVQRLLVQEGDMMFGNGRAPLLRGRRAETFRPQNYSGSIEFNGQVQSVNPLVLADDQGNRLPVTFAGDIEVHRSAPRPVKEGDITAGADLMAMGDTTPDGLVNAHLIVVFSEGGRRGSMPGTITAISGDGLTVRPRFAPKDIAIHIDPAVKVYDLERLDLDAIRVGDTLNLTGKVIGGDAKAPTALVVRTITPADSETPNLDPGGDGGFFERRPVTATVKGRVTSLDPFRIQTDDGRDIRVTVPGQVTFARFRPADRGTLAAGRKVLLVGRSGEGGQLIADLIILNPSLAMGSG
jgi:hypothetical protein